MVAPTQWLPSTSSMFSLAKTWTIGDADADATEVPYEDADGDILSPSAPRRSSTARRASAIHLSSILQIPTPGAWLPSPSIFHVGRSILDYPVPLDDDDDDDEEKKTRINDARLRAVKEDDASEQGELPTGAGHELVGWSRPDTHLPRSSRGERRTTSSASSDRRGHSSCLARHGVG
jgi:hypothetical protein